MQTKAIYSNYKITNNINGKSYIGYTARNLKRRKQEHIWESKKESPKCLIHRAIKKYGAENFTFEIIWQSPCKQTTLLAESYFISIYNSMQPNGYNIQSGGLSGGCLGYKHTPETIEHLREVNKGNKYCLGYKHTPETIEHLREVNKGNKHALGHKHSQETINKIVKKTSKEYLITFPDGKQQHIKNLTQFCKEYNLNTGNMSSVAKGKLNHHKKFKCEYA